MIKNYFRVAIRNIQKYKTFSFINIAGLAIGIACSLLVFLFASYELSYDSCHEKGDRIYRLASRASFGNTRINQTSSSSQTFREFTEAFPEIENGVKFLNIGRVPLGREGRVFFEPTCWAVDSTYFDVFTQPMIHGDPATALTEPNTIVLTSSAAKKYFGRTDVIGESLTIIDNDDGEDLFCTVTGVCEELPGNAHFHPSMLLSMVSFKEYVENTGWSWNNYRTYFLLAEGASAPALQAKMAEYLEERNIREMGIDAYREREARGDFWEYYLQPVRSIHLDSDLNGEFEANGNRAYVYMFMVISVVILVIACFNFMNLSTARSSLRAREVSIRKVVGSTRWGLIRQFLGESVFLSAISCTIAVGIVYLLLPGYRDLVGRDIRFDLIGSPVIIAALFGFTVLLGLLSGIYPAFVLSSFDPVKAMKGRIGRDGRELWIRNGLIVLQFSIAIFLIIGVMTVHGQMSYLQDKALGFDKEQVLVIDNPGALGERTNSFKDVLNDQPGVVAVSGASTIPGSRFSNNGFRAEGVDNGFTLNRCVCDPDYLETMKLEMAHGRFFSREFPSDSSAVVLNMAAFKLLGWDDPIGKKINNGPDDRNQFHVIGVVEDYHYESLHQDIRPMALFFSGGNYSARERYISVRLETADVRSLVSRLEGVWKEFVPGFPYSYSFLDERYDSLYRNEQQISSLFTVFSILAIIIGCLGLFGLSAFVVDRKMREIGIRKVFGASVPAIVRQLNTDFLKVVLVANIFAWPAAWLVMSRWLENFAYRIDISIMTFFVAGSTALVIALITVSFQAVKGALADPVQSLKCE